MIFEGRDAAGKGGAIKRITERLNPARLPCRRARHADRAREDAVVLPALRAPPSGGRRDRPVRSLLVQPRRRRARDGVLHRGRVPRSSCARARSSSGCSCAPGSILVKYWFSVSDEEQERRFQARVARPSALEAEPDGPRVARPLGRLLARQGRDVPLHGHQAGAVVGGRGRRQAPRAAELHPAPALPDPLRGPHPAPLELPPRAEDAYVRPPLDEQTFVPAVY